MSLWFILGWGTPPWPALATPAEAVGRLGAAPAGCWQVADGCLGRTGAADTRSIRGEAELAWTWQIPAEIGGRLEEEPRVWHERVYVCVRTSAGGAALFALGTHDGRSLVPPLLLPTLLPLDPCVGEHGVLLRSGADEIRVVAVVDGRWATLWGPVNGDGTLAAPLLHAGIVVGQIHGGLRAWRYPWRTLAWEVHDQLRGRPALDAARIYAVHYDEAGNAYLHSTSLAEGTRRRHGLLGHHGTQFAPAAATRTHIVLNDGVALVQHGAPVLSKGGQASTSILHAGLESGGLWDWSAPPAAAGSRWLGYPTEGGSSALKLGGGSRDGTMTWWTLADAKEQPAFYRPDLSVTVAGSTAWIGTRAFDLDSHEIVCRLPEESPVMRPVPAHGLMLVCPQHDRLHAWREEATPADTPVFLGAAFAETAPRLTSVSAGRILFRGDALYSGPYDLDPAGTLTLRPLKGKPSTRPLTDALVALEGADQLLYAASITWLPRHLDRLTQLSSRAEVAEWIKEAQRSQDARRVEQLLARALAVGLTDKELAGAHRFLNAQISSPRKVDAKREAKLQETLRLHELAGQSALLATLVRGFADPRPVLQRTFLRHVLDRDPAHVEAVAHVRASLPPHVAVPEPFVARDWLEARLALAAIPTRQVEVPAEGSRKLTPGERELGSARHYWRPDLAAFETDQLLIMTSLKEPDRLARCLGLGELVCTALEEVCKGGQHVRTYRWPLILQLFETEAEYRTFASGAREPESTREWSAGHYDPTAGVSRIYVPAGDEAFEGVMRTYAHELTHHWIQERCPLFEAREAVAAGPTVNWIVEGMAELVESFRWNLAERTWQTFNPQAGDLDALAGAPPRADWIAFFDVTDAEFQRLDRAPVHKVRLGSALGKHTTLSELNLFYATAGSVCMYLYHAGAREREALLAYLRDAYTGKVRPATPHIRERFGLSPAELGRAASDWARRVVAGEITRKQVFLR